MKFTSPRFIKKILAFIPTPLPVGLTAFDAWVTDLLDLYQFPDLPSYRQAIATMVLHLGSLTSSKSRHFFARTIKASMSKQVAYEALQQSRAKAEAAEKPAEAPTPPAPVPVPAQPTQGVFS